MKLLFKCIICLLTLGLFSYSYVDRLNAQTELKLQIPQLAKEIERIKQDTIELSYEVECFKNPQHLLQLAKQPQFSHLKFPYAEEIVVVPSGIAKAHFADEKPAQVPVKQSSPGWPIFLGTQ